VIVVDSTVSNYPEKSAQRGWGMFMQDHFSSAQLQVKISRLLDEPQKIILIKDGLNNEKARRGG
jgi:hypothetical protein